VGGQEARFVEDGRSICPEKHACSGGIELAPLGSRRFTTRFQVNNSDSLEGATMRPRRPSALAYSVCALVALSLAAAPAVAQTSVAVAGPGTNVSNIRIDNFGVISPNFFRGAQPNGRDYADLAAAGVKTVINLTSDDAQPGEQVMVEKAGMKYVQIAMTTHRPPTSSELAAFLKIANDPTSQPIYVHCVGGRHRTGVMTAVYRMSQDGWTADQAFSEMKQYKYGADFLHPEFRSFGYGYRPEQSRPAPSPEMAAAKRAGG
jgi:protein tyrosine phosphatase (PTP) superfamily phosphohydrolase (DUF442 family)